MPYSSTLEAAAPEVATAEEPSSTMPQPSMSDAVAVDVPKSSTTKLAASATTSEDMGYGHHILFRRTVACSKRVRHVNTASVNLFIT